MERCALYRESEKKGDCKKHSLLRGRISFSRTLLPPPFYTRTKHTLLPTAKLEGEDLSNGIKIIALRPPRIGN